MAPSTNCGIFVLIAMLYASLATRASADQVTNLRIDRTDTSLGFSWDSDAHGNWVLIDDAERTCAYGAAQRGHNNVVLPKISGAPQLRLHVSADKFSSRAETYIISGKRRLSTLPRITDRSSVIYQLPVRTYLATDRGAAHAGQLRALTTQRLQEIRSLGVDYLWLTGVIEHASRANSDPDVVKGDAGSFYAIHDSWDVSPQIGTLQDFVEVLDRAHAVGLRVLIDFVANHTARVHRTDVACKQQIDFGNADRLNYFFHRDNNYYYIHDPENSVYIPPRQTNVPGSDGQFDIDLATPGVQYETPAKTTGNDIVSPNPVLNDWFEAVKLNYGFNIETRQAEYVPMPKTWWQVADIAKYWLELGVDGFRADFAHSVPMEFWRYFVNEIRSTQPQAFLLAEAYENGDMKLPGFSYDALFQAGFDSIYNSYLYWGMRDQAMQSASMSSVRYLRSAAGRQSVFERGDLFMQYVENHDEVRVASPEFARSLQYRNDRAHLGFAYATYLALMPGNFLLHGGQEYQEDASITGPYSRGHRGATSIFDFVYQAQVRSWYRGEAADDVKVTRLNYQSLLNLKGQEPFSLKNRSGQVSFIDLEPANYNKSHTPWVGAYLRFSHERAFLVVANTDPHNAHEVTIHFTTQTDSDPFGALAEMRIENVDRRYVFTDRLARPGWQPKDPAIEGEGIPGRVLYQQSDVPSGLYLGSMPPRTTYVLEVQAL